MHGKGTYTWAPEPNGKSNTYTGAWVEACSLWTTEPKRYDSLDVINEWRVGQWKDDKKHGTGTVTWPPEPNGKSNTYTGGWVEGKRTGHGVYIFANGDRYEGICSQITSVFTAKN
ncbi:unnamed protein product [Adineta ricciae]|uniref:Uncharacterized protein n=1 Tax=Adineta ricciae TaxID=249248 RepID=A0A814C556_ADIRI|nr:unnamed protein product [Adineta ricciae]CAF1321494.1 unnamed protein product [Adineta ricciae]